MLESYRCSLSYRCSFAFYNIACHTGHAFLLYAYSIYRTSTWLEQLMFFSSSLSFLNQLLIFSSYSCVIHFIRITNVSDVPSTTEEDDPHERPSWKKHILAVVNVGGVSYFLNDVNIVYMILSVGLDRFVIVGNLCITFWNYFERFRVCIIYV